MAILISLQIPLLTQSGLPEAVDDAEAYAVYASILPHDWIVVDAHATSLVIRKETVTNWSCMPSGRQFEAEWRPVIDSLRRENRSVRTLRPLFHLGLPYTLVATSELNALFQAPGYSWADFHRRFPGSGGYIELSAVGFDDSKARAIVYLAHHCVPGMRSWHASRSGKNRRRLACSASGACAGDDSMRNEFRRNPRGGAERALHRVAGRSSSLR